MKKIFLTLFMLTVTLVWAAAQTDVTKFFLKNYSFDSNYDYKAGQTQSVAQEILDIPEWTKGFTVNYTITGVYEFGFAGTFNNGTVPSVGYDGEAGGGLALSTGWGQDFYYTQTVTLPAGSYVLTVPTYNGFTATGGTSVLAWIPNSGTTVSSSVSIYPSRTWTVDEISFTLNKKTTGKIRIGYKAAANGSGNSANLVIDYLKLMATDIDIDAITAEQKSQLFTLISSANSYYGDGSGNNAAALKNAIDAAQQVYDNASATLDEVYDQNENLTEAIGAYRKDNISPDNPYEVYYITNPSFEEGSKNWAVSGFWTQTNTSFSKKKGSTYIEKWVGTGSAAGNASASQEVTLPNGIYRLTVAAQNLTEGATTKQNTGMYVFAGSQKTPIYTPNDYSVDFSVITGKVTLGVNAEGATGNWLALDNFRLYQIGYIDEAALIEELSHIVANAEELLPSMMSATSRNSLVSAINDAKEITSGEKSYDAKVTIALEEAIDAANVSIAEYQALVDEIAKVQAVYDESKNGAAELQAAIDKATALSQNDQATSKELSDEITILEKAELAFNIANATEGEGVAPTVTYTNPDFIGGSTKAMLRATFSGTNYLERGVCWSTEHNPTVLDSRSTKIWILNGAILVAEGLSSATVYYMRPYIISKTYQVSYGDEVKVVTHPKGNCTWSWDEAGPDEATNTRCRNAVRETIEYFNEWTGVMGFHLSGHYVPGAGSGGGTADCSYGGYMRISQNVANQAIGTVLHETGHGVGVGTHTRYADSNVHSWYWYGREANKIYHFLENEYVKVEFAEGNKVWVGDGTHAWGQNSTYDWFINGSDKDKHLELQYAGGSALLYGMFIDGLDPTSSNYYTTDHNGIAGYTFNFDDDKKYYLMCKDKNWGLGTSLIYASSKAAVEWADMLSPDTKWYGDSAAWYMLYNPENGHYLFKNAKFNWVLSHPSSGIRMYNHAAPTKWTDDDYFQLMPDRRDITVSAGDETITTHGYWFTWTAGTTFRSLILTNSTLDPLSFTNFDYSDNATRQQYIIISEDELPKWKRIAEITSISGAKADVKVHEAKRGKFLEGGRIVIYNDGKRYNTQGGRIK